MSISADKELYSCNGCGEIIKKQRARISCNVCVDFNLCSNCYVINYFSKPHTKSHASTIIRESGQITCNKVKSKQTPHLDTSEHISVPLVEKQRKYSEIPTANWGALWNVMKAPLAKRDPTSKNLDKVEASDLQQARHRNNSTSPLSISPGLTFPQLAVESQTQGAESPGPTYFCPGQWEPFFGDNNSPSSIFVALMSLIFNRLDDKRTGYLTPETYSGFLDMQGYPLQANKWKMAFEKAAGASSKHIADLELGLYFSQHSISHILVARSTEPIETKAYSKKLSNSAINENMPLLLRQGFIDISAYDYLKDPSLAYQYLINVLQELKIWKELGDLPRSALPRSPKNQNSPCQLEIEEVSLQTPKIKCDNKESLATPKTDDDDLVSLATSKTDYEDVVSLATPKTEYEDVVSLATPKTEYEDVVSLATPKIEYEDEFKLSFQSDQLNNQLTIGVVDEREEKSKLALFQENTPDDGLLSPKFTLELQEDLSPQLSIQTRRSFSKKTPRLGALNSNLVVNTDFSSTWLSTASALSACDPQRRKVETIVEAYEHVRANSVCLDSMSIFRDTALSGKSTL